MNLGTFKKVIYKMCLPIIYLLYMYKEDLVSTYYGWNEQPQA